MVMVMLMALLIGILQSWNLKAVGALCNERHDLQVRNWLALLHHDGGVGRSSGVVACAHLMTVKNRKNHMFILLMNIPNIHKSIMATGVGRDIPQGRV